MQKLECERCAGTGIIGLHSATFRYAAPGPVPEDARGFVEATCDECRGAGYDPCITCNGEGWINKHANLPDEPCPNCKCEGEEAMSPAVERAMDFFWRKADEYDRQKLQADCDHDVEEIHDPRKPFGFEAWSCKKCGTKFYIPKGEAV
jgi:hypothetical protein